MSPTKIFLCLVKTLEKNMCQFKPHLLTLLGVFLEPKIHFKINEFFQECEKRKLTSFSRPFKKMCCKTDFSLKQLINLTASAVLSFFLAVFVVFPN